MLVSLDGLEFCGRFSVIGLTANGKFESRVAVGFKSSKTKVFKQEMISLTRKNIYSPTNNFM